MDVRCNGSLNLILGILYNKRSSSSYKICLFERVCLLCVLWIVVYMYYIQSVSLTARAQNKMLTICKKCELNITRLALLAPYVHRVYRKSICGYRKSTSLRAFDWSALRIYIGIFFCIQLKRKKSVPKNIIIFQLYRLVQLIINNLRYSRGKMYNI